MKNADMPAMPVDVDQFMSAEMSGLTKREYFAAMAMQGMAYRDSELHPGGIAHDAAQLADALLAGLERTK